MNAGVNRACERELRAVLRAWTKIQDELAVQYVKVGEVPWWYTEAASLSTFSGAIWRTNGDVLHEYGTTKFRRDKQGARRRINGRCDIYFRTGSTYYVGEAKRCLVSMSASRPEAKIQKKLVAATTASMELPSPVRKGYRRAAILFVTFYVRRTERIDLNELIKRWNEAFEMMPGVSIAWTFPQVARKFKYGPNFYPGTAVVIEVQD